MVVDAVLVVEVVIVVVIFFGLLSCVFLFLWL